MWTLIALFLGFLVSASPASGQMAEDLEERIPALMTQAGIPGLSAALIEGGSVTWTGAFGTRDIDTGAPVSDETVFEAASLSKPVVAYLTLKLASRGLIDLDSPLWDDAGYARLDHDPRAAQITPRMVLSHTSGLPNWGGTPLTLNHDPGTAWNYSGEGFVFLAEMLERQTGTRLNDLLTAEVFGPLGMDRSSFVWRPDYESDAALPHDMIGRVMEKTKLSDEVAAASLHTTASDYASFVQAVLSGDGLSEGLAGEMLSEQAAVSGWGDRETWAHLSWGLG